MGMVGKVNKETFVCKTWAFSFLVSNCQNVYFSFLVIQMQKFENFSFFYGLLSPAVTPVVSTQSFNNFILLVHHICLLVQYYEVKIMMII